MRNFATVQRMAELGYDFVGLHAINTLAASRLAEFRVLRTLVAQQQLAIKPVLLTKVTDIEQVVLALDHTGIDWLQLHRTWSPAALAALRDALSSCHRTVTIILLIDPAFAPSRVVIEESLGLVDFAILDNKTGGTGRPLPIPAVQRVLDVVDPRRIFLAGGLNVDNVGEIVRRYHPYAVDAQSGLLDAVGNQDPFKLEEFIRTVRSASHTTG